MDLEKFKNGKKSAVCISIDDVCPLSTPSGDFGGKLKDGRLGKLLWLAERHPQLKFTLFTTADWREISSVPTRKLTAKIPWLRDKVFLAERYAKGRFSLAAHPEFVDFINGISAFEVALHGLNHCHKGLVVPVEFQDETKEKITEVLREMISIFDASGIDYVRGFCPPAWNAPTPLLQSLVECGVNFISSARDLVTEISTKSLTAMSGMKGLPLIFPAKITDGKMIHFPVNFQATSRAERAMQILEYGGLLSIKAHISDGMLDMVSDVYMNYLDLLFSKIEDKFGDDVCWTSMGEMSKRIFSA